MSTNEYVFWAATVTHHYGTLNLTLANVIGIANSHNEAMESAKRWCEIFDFDEDWYTKHSSVKNKINRRNILEGNL